MGYESAVVMGFIGIGVVLVYALENISWKPIKKLFFFIALFLILINLNVMSVIATSLDNIQSNIGMAYQICLWSFVFVLGYFIIIFIRETVLSTREKRKRKMEGEE